MHNVYTHYSNNKSTTLATHKTCAFGQFYYSLGQEIFKNDRLYKEIEPLHIRVHELGNLVMSEIQAENRIRANEYLQELQNTVDEMIAMLDKLIHQYFESDWRNNNNNNNN